MDLRMLRVHDAEAFVQLRIEALTREPYAFSRLPEAPLPWPLEQVPSPLPAVLEDNGHVGAFANGLMVGQADRQQTFVFMFNLT